MRRQLLFLLLPLIFYGCSEISDTSPVYTLETSVTPKNSGTISPDSGEYNEGERIEVKAEADSGYEFAGWGGDLSGEEATDTLHFDSDKNITALFEEKMYSLNFEVEGWGSIRKEVIQAKTDYQEGTVVELTADPRDDWEFSHWEKDLEGEDNPVTITVDEEKTIKAVFVEEMDDSGDGGDSGGDGGNNGNGGNGDNGVNGDDGNGNNGDNGGNGNDGGDPDPPEAFTVSASVNGKGSVSLNPDKQEYEEGEEIQIKAKADKGWKFSHWQGDLSGDKKEVNITVKQSLEVTAVFEEK